MNVKIKKLNENAVIPTYGSPYAAGADLYACIENDQSIAPGETKLIETGLAIELPSWLKQAWQLNCLLDMQLLFTHVAVLPQSVDLPLLIRLALLIATIVEK